MKLVAAVLKAAAVVVDVVWSFVVRVVNGGLVELVVGLLHEAPDLNSTASFKSVHRASNSLGPSSISFALANGEYVSDFTFSA